MDDETVARRCATCPALTQPNRSRTSALSGGALRGWVAWDGRIYCTLCVMTAGMFARREA